jgi:hypothetical protein
VALIEGTQNAAEALEPPAQYCRKKSDMNKSLKKNPLFTRFAKAASLAAVILLGVVSSASATEGTASALGFYTETKGGTCQSNICVALFKKVAAGQTLIVTNVSCNLGMGSTGTPVSLSLNTFVNSSTDPVGPTTHLTPAQTGEILGNRTFASNDQVLHVFGSGRIPRILFFAGATALSQECTIAGQLRKS